MTNKQKILEILQKLPDEATVDDAIDELCLLQKIELGLAQADAGDVISHDAFKKQLQRSSATELAREER